ncbi:sensor domain-containing diguanylate cyclase [Sphingomicrobium astaxanthinifaciens]|uniref:sensor domain-containing diguanylate cyclase n=1 Tax=Sphingomicrobium astaxanthinifaciens TaxID=1227949 RepID=UPI001FCB20F6|nr:sensor domain-containing diguanylate cyclase [Sphingomicrobium astaxanthinifaciens]MCJ7420301.1 sensor domain-containing diguanylate cyclase [Sphingomicrobium astaxanthinifaciens]
MRNKLKTDEQGRIRALNRLQILDTSVEKPFENIVSLVKQTLNVPISAVSLVDTDRQWFKASCGLPTSETARDISFCTHTIQNEVPFIVEDAAQHPFMAESPLVTSEPNIRSYAGIPLKMSDGYNVGALCAIDTKPREFTKAEIAILENFARIVVDELELREIASIDTLTGSLSRRAWTKAAEAELSRISRYHRDCAILILDIDHFKSVNDEFGHDVGDEVLARFVTVASAQLRETDVMGRIGGEEFAILLPETNLEASVALGNRICDALRATTMSCLNGRACTVSVGAAKLDAAIGLKRAMRYADEALYDAKSLGRDRVCSAEPKTESEAA